MCFYVFSFNYSCIVVIVAVNSSVILRMDVALDCLIDLPGSHVVDGISWNVYG